MVAHRRTAGEIPAATGAAVGAAHTAITTR